MTGDKYSLQIWRRAYIDPMNYKIASIDIILNKHEYFVSFLKYAEFYFDPLNLTLRDFFMNCSKNKELAGRKPSTFYEF